MTRSKYGVVYTPRPLAEFVASLLCEEAKKDNVDIKAILDPACGEGALLDAAKRSFGRTATYIGIDVDNDIRDSINDDIITIIDDAIMPAKTNSTPEVYWKQKLPPIQLIIANPPWSSEKLYGFDDLKKAGYSLGTGQYDCYVLFIELAYKLLEKGGLFAFLLPDSVFDAQNERLRELLSTKMEIRTIARLGEKLFPEVNRATTVIVCKKNNPTETSVTNCFRLSTEERKEHLSGKHELFYYYKKNLHIVEQSRFVNNDGFLFDIDARSEEFDLLNKIKNNAMDWSDVFVFGRGVEISKHGKVVVCPCCGSSQGYKKQQLESGVKECTECEKEFEITRNDVHTVISQKKEEGMRPIYIGENIKRYRLNNGSYIIPDVKGINYKDISLYNPPKILIRKTGLGIYATIDYSGSMTTQTVYIAKYKNPYNKTPLEYYLALINSRVIYYYYLKIYGENEWKSHPYITKKILFSLPIRSYEGTRLDKEIIDASINLQRKYEYSEDIKLESLIMRKYNLSEEERKMIYREMNRLPDLGAVKDMKGAEECTGTSETKQN